MSIIPYHRPMRKILSYATSLIIVTMLLILYPWPSDAPSILWSIALLACGADAAVLGMSIAREVKNRHGKD